jgi:hypothetical protein
LHRSVLHGYSKVNIFANISARSLLTKAREDSYICNGTVIAYKPAAAQPVRSPFLSPGELPPFPMLPTTPAVAFQFRPAPVGLSDRRGIGQKIVEKHVPFFNPKKASFR